MTAVIYRVYKNKEIQRIEIPMQDSYTSSNSYRKGRIRWVYKDNNNKTRFCETGSEEGTVYNKGLWLSLDNDNPDRAYYELIGAMANKFNAKNISYKQP